MIVYEVWNHDYESELIGLCSTLERAKKTLFNYIDEWIEYDKENIEILKKDNWIKYTIFTKDNFDKIYAIVATELDKGLKDE